MAMYLHRLIVRRKYAWLGLLTHSTAGHDNGRNRQRSSPSPRLRRPQHQPRTALFSDGSPDVDLSPNDEQLVRSSARLRSDHDLQVLALEGRRRVSRSKGSRRRQGNNQEVVPSAVTSPQRRLAKVARRINARNRSGISAASAKTWGARLDIAAVVRPWR